MLLCHIAINNITGLLNTCNIYLFVVYIKKLKRAINVILAMTFFFFFF